MQILMIEDEPRVADFVRRGLRPEGWMVDIVNSAEDGLEQLKMESYDVMAVFICRLVVRDSLSR